MNIMTFRYSLSSVDCFEKIIHNGLFVILTIISFFSDVELEIVWIIDQNDFEWR